MSLDGGKDKQEIAKFASEHGHAVTENSRKSFRHSLKVLSDLGSRDSRKEKERRRVNNRRKEKRKML